MKDWVNRIGGWLDRILELGTLLSLAGLLRLGLAGPLILEIGGQQLLRVRQWERPAVLLGLCLGLRLLRAGIWKPGRLERLAFWPLLLVLVAGAALTIPHQQLFGFDADTYGYVSEAEALLDGQIFQPEDVYAPLGLPPVPGTTVPIAWTPAREFSARVPVYPVGWPLHLAAAELLRGGPTGMLLTPPVISLLLVVAVFLVGRELADVAVGLIGAVLLILSPVWQLGGISLLGDNAAALWCAGSFLCLLRSDKHPGWGIPAGLAAGISVLIRPNLALGVGLCWLYLLVRRRWRAAGWMALGALPVALFQAGWQQSLYGSPWRTGYGPVGDLFGAGWFQQQFRFYGGGLLERQGIPVFLAALVGLILPRRRSGPRVLLLLLFLGLLGFYSIYRSGGDWISFRFFLPWLWGILLLAAMGIVQVSRRFRRGWRPVVVVILLAVVLGGAWQGMVRERKYGHLLGWQRVALIRVQEAAAVAARTEPEAVIFSFLHSGILRQRHQRRSLSYRVWRTRFAWAVRSLAEQDVPLYLLRHGSVPCPHLEDFPDWFEHMLDTGENASLYRIRRSAVLELPAD